SPSKPKVAPERIAADLTRASMQQVLAATASAATAPSECPTAAISAGSTTPRNGPPVGDHVSIDEITKPRSAGSWERSSRSAGPGYAELVPGKSGAATTYPPDARSVSSGAYAAASMSYPWAKTSSG